MIPPEEQLEKVLFGPQGAYGWNKESGILGEIFKKLEVIEGKCKEITDWKQRLTGLPAKAVYFILAALSIATFILNVIK